MLVSLPHVSVTRLLPMLDTSSKTPSTMTIAINPPLVKLNSSSNHGPKVMPTHWLAPINMNELAKTNQALAGTLPRACSVTGAWASSRGKPAANNAPVSIIAIAPTMNPARHEMSAVAIPMMATPMNSDKAHDVSITPTMRPRLLYGT